MEFREWMEAFERAAEELYPNDPDMVFAIVRMEAARIRDDIVVEEPDRFVSPHLVKNAWRATTRAMVGKIPAGDPDPSGLIQAILARRNAAVAPNAADLERTAHNERVRLNATFLNSLAVWFAGAGSAGGLISTFVASSHNFAGAGEVAVIGLILAVVLKLLANRAIGKLR